MSNDTQTGTQRTGRHPSTGGPQWRPVRWQWRRPRLVEVTGSLATVSVAAVAAGYVPEGVPALGAAGAFALHSMVSLGARCVRRTRD